MATYSAALGDSDVHFTTVPPLRRASGVREGAKAPRRGARLSQHAPACSSHNARLLAHDSLTAIEYTTTMPARVSSERGDANGRRCRRPKALGRAGSPEIATKEQSIVHKLYRQPQNVPLCAPSRPGFQSQGQASHVCDKRMLSLFTNTCGTDRKHQGSWTMRVHT